MKLVIWTFVATAVLVAVVHVLSHEKATEFGLLWLFEQAIGAAKASFLGSSAE